MAKQLNGSAIDLSDVAHLLVPLSVSSKTKNGDSYTYSPLKEKDVLPQYRNNLSAAYGDYENQARKDNYIQYKSSHNIQSTASPKVTSNSHKYDSLNIHSSTSPSFHSTALLRRKSSSNGDQSSKNSKESHIETTKTNFHQHQSLNHINYVDPINYNTKNSTKYGVSTTIPEMSVSHRTNSGENTYCISTNSSYAYSQNSSPFISSSQANLPSYVTNSDHSFIDNNSFISNASYSPYDTQKSSVQNSLQSLPNYQTSNVFDIKNNISILGPEEVRWFYKTADNKWTPFIGYDSIKIEWAYTDYVHKIIANENSFKSSMSKEDILSQMKKPVVCGGLYEVDVSSLKGYSIYWEAEEEFTIMRGTWFFEWNWLPVEASIAKQIEVEHLGLLQSNFPEDVGDKEGQERAIHSLTLSEGHIDWFSSGDVFFSHEATPSRLMRSVSKKFGFQKTGYKLHRGYCFDASLDDKPPDITHIVFVIHGIGQKMETGRIIKNCTSLRESVKWLKEKQFPEHDFTKGTFEFFPVEWRSSLTLDSGIIDSITPHKIIGLRQMLNASFMDIMYYNSPQYREEIIDGLTRELERLYELFTARNPYFEANGGKVSIIAHSLGCVITYDIITGWQPSHQSDPDILQSLVRLSRTSLDVEEAEVTLSRLRSALDLVHEKITKRSKQKRLPFKVENFFCLGSPLAVFLGLRRKEPNDDTMTPFRSQERFQRLFNIFHPADPVAYRIEPLLCPSFSSVAPLAIHSYTSASKTPYEGLPSESLMSVSPRLPAPLKDFVQDYGPRDVDAQNASASAASWNFWNFMKTKKNAETSLMPKSPEMSSKSDAMRNRIDFVLREGSMESSYLSAITSHTSYWSNMDVANFLLCTFCPFVLEEPVKEPQIT